MEDDGEDLWFEIPELVADARRTAAVSTAKATYTAGPSLEEQSGCPALLSVALCNSPLNGGSREAMEPLAATVAAAGLRWLQATGRAMSGTGVEVIFADAAEVGPFSSFNALETMRFTLNAQGALEPLRSTIDPEWDRTFREMRYGLSGRKPPPT